jgi:hypothetical protein
MDWSKMEIKDWNAHIKLILPGMNSRARMALALACKREQDGKKGEAYAALDKAIEADI